MFFDGNILSAALDKWGENKQTDILIEEMSELTQEIIKTRRAHCPYKSFPLIEEMVDVMICIEQLKLVLRKDFMGNFDQTLQNLADQKMRRLAKRIEDEHES